MEKKLNFDNENIWCKKCIFHPLHHYLKADFHYCIKPQITFVFNLADSKLL